MIQDILHTLGKKETVFGAACAAKGVGFMTSVAGLIDEAKTMQCVDGKDKMFTLQDLGLTIVLCMPHVDALREISRRNNVAAIMYIQGRSSWHTLHLTYNNAGILMDAKELTLRQSEFSVPDWKLVVNLGDRLMERRTHGN